MPTQVMFEEIQVEEQVLETITVKESIEKLLNSSIESCSESPFRVVNDSGYHPLFAAVHRAYADHYPLALSPDMIWLLICQGLALHVNQNAEELRRHFVQFEGKKEIIVFADHLIKGSIENDWMSVWHQFSDKLEKYIGDKRDLLVADFSTTTPYSKAASEIVMMDAMQSYFEYTVVTLCGIPHIKIEGTTEDWENIRKRVDQIAEFSPPKWIAHLRVVCDQFIRASKDDFDKSFWKNIYKEYGGSGGPKVTGWLAKMLPYITRRTWDQNGRKYIKSYVPNYTLDEEEVSLMSGISHPQYPSGLSKVPFKWHYHGTDYPYEFIAGFVGYTQYAGDKMIHPKIGWAVKPA